MFHPQRHSLHEQLTVYSAADELVFCDGAALHSCVLLPDLAAWGAVVSRRHDLRWDGSGITDQFTGYGQDATWLDAVRYQYQFGLESWDARSFVDWYDVSTALVARGFTETAFRAVGSAELVASELHNYVGAIRDDPRFTRYLMQLRTEPVRSPSPRLAARAPAGAVVVRAWSSRRTSRGADATRLVHHVGWASVTRAGEMRRRTG